MHKYLQIIELKPTFFGKWNISHFFLQMKNIKFWKAAGQQSQNIEEMDSQPQ